MEPSVQYLGHHNGAKGVHTATEKLASKDERLSINFE